MDTTIEARRRYQGISNRPSVSVNTWDLHCMSCRANNLSVNMQAAKTQAPKSAAARVPVPSSGDSIQQEETNGPRDKATDHDRDLIDVAGSPPAPKRKATVAFNDGPEQSLQPGRGARGKMMSLDLVGVATTDGCDGDFSEDSGDDGYDRDNAYGLVLSHCKD